MKQNLAARLWTDSSFVALTLLCGSHIVAAHSNCGRTGELQHFVLTSFVHVGRFIHRKTVVWLAHFVTKSVWLFQVSLSSIMTPRYLACEVSFNVWL